MAEELDPVERLVELIQAGVEREENFHKIFDLNYHRTLSFFRRKGFSQEESKDLTQETFLRVFKAIDGFRHESSFEWWLSGVASLVYKNELRRRNAEKRSEVDTSVDEGMSEGQMHLESASEAGGPLEVAVKNEQVLALREALKKLPPQMRTCCILRYVKGLKYQEIAIIMNISIETVKAHLFQGRKRLAAMLGESRALHDKSL